MKLVFFLSLFLSLLNSTNCNNLEIFKNKIENIPSLSCEIWMPNHFGIGYPCAVYCPMNITIKIPDNTRKIYVTGKNQNNKLVDSFSVSILKDDCKDYNKKLTALLKVIWWENKYLELFIGFNSSKKSTLDCKISYNHKICKCN